MSFQVGVAGFRPFQRREESVGWGFTLLTFCRDLLLRFLVVVGRQVFIVRVISLLLMTVWLVRAGKYGEAEQVALSRGIATIGWTELPDLSECKTKEDLTALYNGAYPGQKKMKVANQVGQVWGFAHEIKAGDLVVLPLKTQSSIAIGRVDGGYTFDAVDATARHYRKVSWLKLLPRTAFEQDLLYSMGAFMTVCKIERNNAQQRILALVQKPDVVETGTEEPESLGAEKIDLERSARDEIIKFINARFKGHGLARLVDAILRAEGYTTLLSPEGPDGGVDILASAGPFGFGSPKICVQVKSSSSPVEVNVFRELQGVMPHFGADRGILVAWGGFKGTITQDARKQYFAIRLWGQEELIEELFKNYDKLDEDLKAEIPMKRIWTLVQDED